MASSSGTTSSTSSPVQNSGSEGELKALMDQRKRKRMMSNRESARRSRMRKQKHLDDLMAQVVQLRKENQQIVSNLGITTQHYVSVESENSILKAQVAELSQRLQSLSEIIAFLNPGSGIFEDGDSNRGGDSSGGGYFCTDPIESGGYFNPLQMAFYMSQPLMASADMFEE